MKVFVDASVLVYLNVRMPEEEAKLIEDLWLRSLSEHTLHTNMLVLDEVLYVSRRKYGISYEDTMEFVDKAVLPYVNVLPLTVSEYVKAKEYVRKYGLRPSDALHAATIEDYGLQAIITEDRDFDRLSITKIWV